MVADQLKVEKEREAELELLYQEEAAKIWEKREAEWEKERKARERLMQEVNSNKSSKQACDEAVELSTSLFNLVIKYVCYKLVVPLLV